MAESMDIRELNVLIEQKSSFVAGLTAGMNRVIVGQKHLVDSLITGLLSDGHILLEGVPGWPRRLPSRHWRNWLTPSTVGFSLLPTCCLPMLWVL